MATESYLHDLPDFSDLLRVVAQQHNVSPAFVEKDYWIMHCLYGLQRQGFAFDLKGGTSLSKGYGIINRFSEDIDIRIEPEAGQNVATGRNQDSPAQRQSRKDFYDRLAEAITINGITEVLRATEFDEVPQYRSGGIRLLYKTIAPTTPALKEGILLELGFDTTTPHEAKTISSWAYDHAASLGIVVTDNRAKDVRCYHAGYTLVEKLQAISTKFRKQQEQGSFDVNFMRHYYDVYCLLQTKTVQDFIGTPAYHAHKKTRFRNDDEPDITRNEAFILSGTDVRARYAQQYERLAALCYGGLPKFEDVLILIGTWATKL